MSAVKHADKWQYLNITNKTNEIALHVNTVSTLTPYNSATNKLSATTSVQINVIVNKIISIVLFTVCAKLHAANGIRDNKH